MEKQIYTMHTYFYGGWEQPVNVAKVFNVAIYPSGTQEFYYVFTGKPANLRMLRNWLRKHYNAHNKGVNGFNWFFHTF
jgi:hypothetical protein